VYYVFKEYFTDVNQLPQKSTVPYLYQFLPKLLRANASVALDQLHQLLPSHFMQTITILTLQKGEVNM